MHDIEPHFLWRDEYMAEEDRRSPFYGREYDEFNYQQKVYNYLLHPQWDDFGSDTLYLKILYAEYEDGYAILELIGEWNDLLHNDIMYLKRDIIDDMIEAGITKYILICENVLNYHGDDDSYYEEWYDDIKDEGGWIVLLNTLPHVAEEMAQAHLDNYTVFGDLLADVNWRPHKAATVFQAIDGLVQSGEKRLY